MKTSNMSNKSCNELLTFVLSKMGLKEIHKYKEIKVTTEDDDEEGGNKTCSCVILDWKFSITVESWSAEESAAYFRLDIDTDGVRPNLMFYCMVRNWDESCYSELDFVADDCYPVIKIIES